MAFTLQIGQKAPAFALSSTDGKTYSLVKFRSFVRCDSCGKS